MKLPLTKDEFLAELLRRYPHLRVEMLPNGEKIVHAIKLKAKPDRDRRPNARIKE